LSFSLPLFRIIGEYSLSWVNNELLDLIFLIPLYDNILPGDDNFDINTCIELNDPDKKIGKYGKEKFINDFTYKEIVSENINQLIIHYNKVFGGLNLSHKIETLRDEYLLSGTIIHNDCSVIYNNLNRFVSGMNRGSRFETSLTGFANYIIKMTDNILTLEIEFDQE
jgi:hypothetical protein